jgi:hypothetical protein
MILFIPPPPPQLTLPFFTPPTPPSLLGLFNSQNNARGGRNVGEIKSTDNASTDNTRSPAVNYDVNDTTAGQYAETYYEGSEITLAWTNQHGCGGNPLTDPHNTHCNLVIQYTCDTVHEDPALNISLANGINDGTPGEGDANSCSTPQAANPNTGRHESPCYYQQCKNRRRNQGLFTADQNLNGNTAIYTRQNAGGNRSGLECDEERDYYPYWSPSPWRDVAYLTSELGATNIDPCEMVSQNSQNVKPIGKCIPGTSTTAQNIPNAYAAITPEDCTLATGVWKEYSWNLPAPECKAAPWSRDNHLGATRDGHYANYTWTIPPIDQLYSGNGVTKPGTLPDLVKCVVRLRYNITTADYDPWNTFAESNQQNSPVTNNPRINVGAASPLRLALNTAQTGRTFQDRSHVFTIRKRPASLEGKRILNLSMIGKRGNVVQTYPAVEYLWMPSHPIVKVGDVIHVQWVGSNTENNNGNGGDGQTGDAGQGQTGSARHNMVLTKNEATNWPLPLDKFSNTLWDKSTCQRPIGPGTNLQALARNDCAITLATAGFYTNIALTTGAHTDGTDLNNQLNNAPPSLINGVLITPNEVGTFPFICSRDNNFSNRDQKGVIYVLP